jgi:threonine aldolase
MHIDLRSDTVTRPTAAMRRAMAEAVVGDDVLGDDPTVIALQEHVAQLLGKEAACFVPSGTMANQCAIRAHTEPGDEVIAHKDSHIIHYETGSPAALSGVMIAPLDGEQGQFDAHDVAAVVRPRSHHFACSKLVIIENTQNRCGGSVWPVARVAQVSAEARRHGLAVHIDGARLWNACIQSGVRPADYAQHADSVSVCFSKGLGAPAGSAVVGSKAFITRVHRFRKMFGGNMRQAGILAAGALHALQNHYTRLADDHARAQELARGLTALPGVTLAFPVATNMVFIDLAPSLGLTAQELVERLRPMGVTTMPGGARRMRLVTHLDTPPEAIAHALRSFAQALGAPAPRPLVSA